MKVTIYDNEKGEPVVSVEDGEITDTNDTSAAQLYKAIVKKLSKKEGE